MTSRCRSSYLCKKMKVDLINLDVDYGMHPFDRMRGFLSAPVLTLDSGKRLWAMFSEFGIHRPAIKEAKRNAWMGC